MNSEELINILDPDKVKCDYCERYFKKDTILYVSLGLHTINNLICKECNLDPLSTGSFSSSQP